MRNSSARNLKYAGVVVILGILSLDLIPLAVSRQKEAAFTGRLSIGQSKEQVETIIKSQHLGVGSFYGQASNLIIVQISRRSRIGTACDEVLYERLLFQNDGLSEWFSWPTQTCG